MQRIKEWRVNTKLLTMILLPWSKTLEVSKGVAADGAAVAGCCLTTAAFTGPLFTLRPRLPLRMPRLRGLDEMMSTKIRKSVDDPQHTPKAEFKIGTLPSRD